MDKISKILRSFDYFGAQIKFNYRQQNKYKNVMGGLIFLVFLIIGAIYVVISFISFIKQENKTVIYYNKELYDTDGFSFSNYSSSFAIGLTCDEYDGEYGQLDDLFGISIMHALTNKTRGYALKNITKVNMHKCSEKDFDPELSDSVKINGIDLNYWCPDENDFLVTGIFSHKIFSFYQLALEIKNVSNGENYIKLFSKYDCKFSLFYSNVAIDVSNVTYPLMKFLDQQFIQLSPVEFKKVNIFFNIKEFVSDDNWFFESPSQNEYLSFSSLQEYTLFKGEKRFETKYEEYTEFARYYIRIATSRNIIYRRFQKFTEFCASSTSVLSAVLFVLYFIINNLNDNYAMEEIVLNILENNAAFKKSLSKEKKGGFIKIGTEPGINLGKKKGDENNSKKMSESKSKFISNNIDNSNELKMLNNEVRAEDNKKVAGVQILKGQRNENGPKGGEKYFEEEGKDIDRVGVYNIKNKESKDQGGGGFSGIYSGKNLGINKLSSSNEQIIRSFSGGGWDSSKLIRGDSIMGNRCFMCSCKKKANKDMIDSSLKQIKRKMDIYYYLKNMRKTEALIQLIMDQNSTILFDALGEIKMNNDNVRTEYDIQKNFWKAFSEVANKGNQNEVERKLIKILNVEMDKKDNYK